MKEGLLAVTCRLTSGGGEMGRGLGMAGGGGWDGGGWRGMGGYRGKEGGGG